MASAALRGRGGDAEEGPEVHAGARRRGGAGQRRGGGPGADLEDLLRVLGAGGPPGLRAGHGGGARVGRGRHGEGRVDVREDVQEDPGQALPRAPLGRRGRAVGREPRAHPLAAPGALQAGAGARGGLPGEAPGPGARGRLAGALGRGRLGAQRGAGGGGRRGAGRPGAGGRGDVPGLPLAAGEGGEAREGAHGGLVPALALELALRARGPAGPGGRRPAAPPAPRGQRLRRLRAALRAGGGGPLRPGERGGGPAVELRGPHGLLRPPGPRAPGQQAAGAAAPALPRARPGGGGAAGDAGAGLRAAAARRAALPPCGGRGRWPLDADPGP
mmetsp:Transcript_20096/g.47372  ORF Transcript_20096/g.47372 Transcript_20096/m.47372 type:complete len:330 (-) Transcript_20096:332-1321(-)